MAALPLEDQPRDLLLGSNNDLVVGHDLSLSKGLAAVAQSCRIVLQMFAGEWFLDLDAGIPYWQSILGQRSDLAVQAAVIAFRAELTAVSGVVEVTRCDVRVDRATRTMFVTFQVRCAFGLTQADTIALAIAGGAS